MRVIERIDLNNSSAVEILETVYLLKQKNITTRALLDILYSTNSHEQHKGNPIIIRELTSTLLSTKGEESAGSFLGKQTLFSPQYSNEYEDIAQDLGIKIIQPDRIDMLESKPYVKAHTNIKIRQSDFRDADQVKWKGKYLDQFKYILNVSGVEEAVSCLNYDQLPEGIISNLQLYLFIYYSENRNQEERVILKAYFDKWCKEFSSIERESSIILHIMKSHDQILQSGIRARIKEIIHLPYQLLELERLCLTLHVSNINKRGLMLYYDIYRANGGTKDIEELTRTANDKRDSFKPYGQEQQINYMKKALSNIPKFISNSSLSDIHFVFMGLACTKDFAKNPRKKKEKLKIFLDNISISYKETPQYADMHYVYYYNFDSYDEAKMLKSIQLLYKYNIKLFNKLYSGTLLLWMRKIAMVSKTNTSKSHLYRLNSNVFNDIANGVRVPVNTMADVISKFNIYM